MLPCFVYSSRCKSAIQKLHTTSAAGLQSASEFYCRLTVFVSVFHHVLNTFYNVLRHHTLSIRGDENVNAWKQLVCISSKHIHQIKAFFSNITIVRPFFWVSVLFSVNKVSWVARRRGTNQDRMRRKGTRKSTMVNNRCYLCIAQIPTSISRDCWAIVNNNSSSLDVRIYL